MTPHDYLKMLDDTFNSEKSNQMILSGIIRKKGIDAAMSYAQITLQIKFEDSKKIICEILRKMEL